jgi:hypothetical protein
MQLQNSDILKGSAVMVFINGEAVAFATSESLSITPNTTEISTKSHGLYPSLVVNSIGWTVSVENLASDNGVKTLNALVESSKNNVPVHLKFAKPGNFDSKGIVNNNHDNWDDTNANTVIYAQGDAIMTNYSWNAPSGDNMTMSAEFTGVGELTLIGDATGLGWSADAATVTRGADNNVFPTLNNPHNLTVTYSSSNTSAATINTNSGGITLEDAGTTTITAAFAGNDDYAATSVTYELTVY